MPTTDPPVPPPSKIAAAIAQVAFSQYATYLHQEEDTPCSGIAPCLSEQIEAYWNDLHALNGQVAKFSSVEVYWSAVFISWCVLKGSGAVPVNFRYSAQHSVFVHAAINDPEAFRGHRIGEYAPRVGDIIQNSRSGVQDFDYARTHSDYPSHSRIVVEKGVDPTGKFVRVVGGNENDSGHGGVHLHLLRLREDGTLVQKAFEPYVCVLENTV